MALFGKKKPVEAKKKEVKDDIKIDEDKIKTIPSKYYNVKGPVLVEGWKDVEKKAKRAGIDIIKEAPKPEEVKPVKKEEKPKKKRNKVVIAIITVVVICSNDNCTMPDF